MAMVSLNFIMSVIYKSINDSIGEAAVENFLIYNVNFRLNKLHAKDLLLRLLKH